jgi:hypothetical protein
VKVSIEIERPKTDEETSPYPTFAIIPTVGCNNYVKTLVSDLAFQGSCSGILILDNGCPVGLANWLDTVDPLLVQRIEMPGAGIHEMWNRGLDEITELHPQSNIAILNDDIIIGPSFLSGLGEGLRSDPNIGVVGANYDGRKGVGIQPVTTICAAIYNGTGGLPGFAFMVRGESDYRFPEECKWWYGDDDIVLTHTNQSSVVAIVLETTVKHIDGGGKTGDWDSPKIRPQLDADREAFNNKWSNN